MVSQSGVASEAGDDGYGFVRFSKIIGYEGGTTGTTTGDVFDYGSGTEDNGVNSLLVVLCWNWWWFLIPTDKYQQ